ncbi:MAG: YjfI family protein [Pseudomonadota bacterium]|nr:YjfI family protein [Pseudomonadota bacterium]
MKSSDRSLKASTLHVRNFRERMRGQGLVKKDVWIRPEHSEELAAIEKAMRDPDRHLELPALPALESGAGWSVDTIHHAIGQTNAVRDGHISLDLIEGAEPSLHLQMHEFGDLSVFVAVGGEQIIVEAFLWPMEQVLDPIVFNAHVLRTHKLLPLSMIALQDVGGVAGYTMLGELDTRSSLANLMFEIETLADNVLNATDAYAAYLRPLPLAVGAG